MKIGKWNFPFPFWSLYVHERVQRRHRHTHVARMSRNALVALSENGMNTIESLQRAAATSRFPLIAGRKSWVVKIITTGPLKEVASSRSQIAQLWARASEDCLA